jgi:hypothetical protein
MKGFGAGGSWIHTSRYLPLYIHIYDTPIGAIMASQNFLGKIPKSLKINLKPISKFCRKI